MLTRFVRIQMAIFGIASVIGLVVLAVFYLQVPMLLGIGRMTVTLELPDTGGLYRFSNVTYRGVQIGRVTAVDITREGVVTATLSLDSAPRIPADLQAQVRSVSAVGEQYVDLRPKGRSGPFLHDGSVIPLRQTSIPQPVGPMLDQVSALISSIPKDKLSALLDESYKGFNGAGYDMGSLIDSASTIAMDAKGVVGHTGRLIDDSAPLLDTQVQTGGAIRTWAHSLAGITRQVANDDSQVRTLLKNAPGALDETARLLEQIKPTLPILLANLSTIAQIAVTYNSALEQVLVLLPPSVASLVQAGSAKFDPTGLARAEFTIGFSDPGACTVGYLPPSQWRSPADTSDADTPDGMYCKLPQDSPIGVRGARNYPCLAHPGKRAPTVEICDSDRPYTPLAMHPHVYGPSPIDPNLLSQGVPPDDRIDFGTREYAPVDGTPMSPGSSPSPATPGQTPGPPSPAGATPAAPSASDKTGSSPPVALAPYNPTTGSYVGADGRMYRQSDLATSGHLNSWKDLVLPK